MATPAAAQDVDPPIITISPTGTVNSNPVTVTIDWCDNEILNQASRSIKLNGSTVTLAFSYDVVFDPNCGAAAQSVGTITLQSGQNTIVARIRDGNFNWGETTVTITLAGPVDVVPFRTTDGTSVGANAASSNVQTFRVKNLGAATETYVFSSLCTGSVSCGTIAPTYLTLAGGDSGWASITYTGGSAGTTGVVKLHAADGNVVDDGWVNVSNQYLAVTSEMNNHDNQKVPLCEASCFTPVLALSTVPYVSLDQPRTLTLVYNGDHVSARPFVYSDVSLASGASTPSEYWLEAKDSVGNSFTFLNGDTKLRFTPPASPTSTTVRLAGQFDASSYGTGVYPITLVVTWATGNPASAAESRSIRTNFQVVNERKSPIARGWTIAGLQRLYPTQGGALITEGDGSATFFLGCGAGCYGRPQGEFSMLSSTGTGGSKTYTRTYADSSVAVFNSAGLLLRTISRALDTVTFTYDGSNRLTQITDPFRTNGSSTHLYTQLSYGTYGLSSIQEPGLFSTQSGGRSTSVSVASDSTLTTWSDPDNVPTRLMYDGSKRLSGFANRRADTTGYHYRSDASWKLDSVVSPRFTRDDGSTGQITTHFEAWQIASVPYASTSSTMKTPVVRDSVFGKITDQGAHVTRFSVNRFGQAVKSIEGLGTNRARVTTLFMNAAHGMVPDSVRRHEGGIDRFTYSADGQVLTQKSAGQSSVNFRYGAYAQVDSVWGSNVPTQRFFIGTRGRVDSAKIAGSHKTAYTYDSRQRVLTIADPASHTTRFHYEGTFGNRDSTEAPGGRFVRVRFDGMGRDTASQANGRPWSRTILDNINRVLKIYRDTGTAPVALPDSVRYVYDSLYLKQVKDGLGQTYAFQVNALGLPTQRTDPSSNVDRYFYDAEGRATKWINRRGDTVFTTYDVLHRVAAKTGSRVVPDSFAFDSAGLVAARWNQNARDSITVDANGWITTVVRRFATDPTKRFVLSYTPDSLHRLLSMTPSTTAGITFATRAYSWENTTGALSGITVDGSSVTMGYDSDLIRSSAVMPSGLTRNESRSTIHGLFQLGFSASGVDQYLWRRVKLDGPGRVLEAYAPDGSNVWKSAFKYDAMGRLVQAADSAIVYQNQCDFPVDPDYGNSLCTGYTASVMRNDTWTYDAVGNVTAIAGTAGTGSVTYATGNRLASWPGYTYAHDSAGNVTRRDTTGAQINYVWSADGLLTSVIAGTDTTFYDYDAGGLLVRKRKSNGVVSRHFWWDGAQLVAELDSLLTSRLGEYAYYPGADKPLALVTGATTITNKYFYQQDALGSVYGLVAEGGTVVRFSGGHVPWGDRSQWASFGSSPADANRLTWKGLMLEAGNTNLYYVRARWYDPRTHRFMSEDPLGVFGGPNTYSIAGNDPVNNSDPTGLLCVTSWESYTTYEGMKSVTRADPVTLCYFETGSGRPGFWDWGARLVDIRGAAGGAAGAVCPKEWADARCWAMAREAANKLASSRDRYSRLLNSNRNLCSILGNDALRRLRGGLFFLVREDVYSAKGGLVAGRTHPPSVGGNRLISLMPAAFTSLDTLVNVLGHEVYHAEFDSSVQSDSNGRGPAYWWGDHCSGVPLR